MKVNKQKSIKTQIIDDCFYFQAPIKAYKMAIIYGYMMRLNFALAKFTTIL